MILEARAILDNDKIQRLAKRIRYSDCDSLSELICYASLAHHGLLGFVELLSLCDVDLTQVPANHLASLVSCVTYQLDIENVTGCDLVSILTSLKCKELGIYRQNLGSEESRALVQTMESVVGWLWLHDGATLDIEALSEYSGQGVCRTVELHGDTRDRYKEDMKTWAGNRNWRVVKDTDREFYIGY